MTPSDILTYVTRIEREIRELEATGKRWCDWQILHRLGRLKVLNDAYAIASIIPENPEFARKSA